VRLVTPRGGEKGEKVQCRQKKERPARFQTPRSRGAGKKLSTPGKQARKRGKEKPLEKKTNVFRGRSRHLSQERGGEEGKSIRRIKGEGGEGDLYV